MAWTLDEGLERLDDEWKAIHPGAVVYHIGDANHSKNPRASQHAPDDGKSGGPGDTVGEVDASDFMPGKGVTETDLDELAEGIRESRDPRILIGIRRQRMFSSYAVAGHPAFTWRPYSGDYHGHFHLSVNDAFKNNPSDWKWEPMANEVPVVKVDGVWVPQLAIGHDDAVDEGINHVARAQLMLNYIDSKTADIQVDGVYGAKTRDKVRSAFGGDGKTINTDQWRRLHGC